MIQLPGRVEGKNIFWAADRKNRIWHIQDCPKYKCAIATICQGKMDVQSLQETISEFVQVMKKADHHVHVTGGGMVTVIRESHNKVIL